MGNSSTVRYRAGSLSVGTTPAESISWEIETPNVDLRHFHGEVG